MEALGRWVRFVFAIRAFATLTLPLYGLVVAIAYWRIHHDTRVPVDELQDRFDFILSQWPLLSHGVIGAISLIAWWALRKGWPSDRPWALAASVAGMFQGRLMGVGIGIAGLIAFWKPLAVAQVAGKPAAAKRVAGDGTSSLTDKVMPWVLLGGLFAARIAWAIWGKNHRLPPSFLPGWLLIGLTIHLGVLFHEAGHFLVGLSSDMVLRKFQLGPFTGQVLGGRWRFGFNLAGLLGGGAVGMVPTQLKHIRGRMVLMILGGPVASLLVGSLSTLLALSAKGSAWEAWWSFFAIFGTFGFLDFIANLIPTRPEAHYSDGAQIYQLMSNGAWAERHLARAMVASSLATPKRPRDFDEGTLLRATASAQEGEEGLYMGLFLAMHYLDSGQTEQGIAAWRKAIEQDPAAVDKLKPDTAAEMAFYEGAIAGDVDRARHWWSRVESKTESRHEVDYWKGRTAVLIAEGQLDRAAEAFRKADEFASKLPEAGAYEYDRWCVDILRQKLNQTDLTRLSQATAAESLPAAPVLT